jgi:hypothetical protein
MANVFTAEAPAAITTSRHLIEQGLDAFTSRASPSARWVFTLCQCLPGLASLS